MRAVQFASVIAHVRRLLEAFQLQMLFMMWTTDDLGIPVPVIFHRLCDTLRETNIGRIYSLRDTLMSPGRRRWRGRPVLGRICL